MTPTSLVMLPHRRMHVCNSSRWEYPPPLVSKSWSRAWGLCKRCKAPLYLSATSLSFVFWRVLRAAYDADYYGQNENETTVACDGDRPATDADSGRLLDCSVDTCPSGTYCRRSAGDITGRRPIARCCPKGIDHNELVMVALWNRADHYIFMLWLILLSSSFFFFFSSPNLRRRRLDVCHTSTHGVALVRI